MLFSLIFDEEEGAWTQFVYRVENTTQVESFYRVFKLDMIYFEVQDGQLKLPKLTSKFKKR